MVKLEDYLYSGDTVLRILRNYSDDLISQGKAANNEVDIGHGLFLKEVSQLLEHNDFLTSQSQRIREYYKYMAKAYPFLAFTFKGRIKSLIRTEEKYNGYILEYISDFYEKTGTYPDPKQITDRAGKFRDLIAYRIVISMPKCHLAPGQDADQIQLHYLYEIANTLPHFLEERGFRPLPSDSSISGSKLMAENVRPYYRDYIQSQKRSGYQSLHITFYDEMSHRYMEVQLRTQEMDDFAEIGQANHTGYEKQQNQERMHSQTVAAGVNPYFDDAYRRLVSLQNLDLSKVDVNMFSAVSNTLMNDGCGLYRGRLILPFEHLSRFQNDLID